MFITKAILLLFSILLQSQAPDFYTEQLSHRNVREAIRDKEAVVTGKIAGLGIELSKLNILLVAFKEEKELEVWAKDASHSRYRKLETFPVCHLSGHLGPKRREFDMQVPEGFYHIDKFNPASRFFLSLGINYPNKSDKIKTTATNPGKDIFIHGSCISAGCLAITNDNIKELYLLAINATRSGQQKIPVYIFPFRMDNEMFISMKENYSNDSVLTTFWQTLKLGYDKFVLTYRPLVFSIDESGEYVFY